MLSRVQLFETPWTVDFVHRLLQAGILEWAAILQGIFPTRGSNLGLLHCRQILYHQSHQVSPLILPPSKHTHTHTLQSTDMHMLRHLLTHEYTCAHTLTHLTSLLVRLSWPLNCLDAKRLKCLDATASRPPHSPPRKADRPPHRVPAVRAPSSLQPERTLGNANHTFEGRGTERKN